MVTREQCIRQLEAAAAAAQDPQSAYQVRTRLKRALLSTVRRVAQLHGLEEPALPGIYTLSPSSAATSSSRKVLELCNELHAQVARLCQPSEALDTRWTDGWQDTVKGLDRLRSLI